MDFLRRLFGVHPEPDATDGPSDLGPEPQAGPLHAGADEPPPESTAIKQEADKVRWRNIAAQTGQSSYAGEIGGVHVATVMKPAKGPRRLEPWEWQLEVPTDGRRHGTSRTLREAKPAVEQALAAWAQ